MATAGFVVALIGSLMSFLPGIGLLAWVISPVGIALAVVGLGRSKQLGSGRGLAISGIALGAFGVIVALIWTIAFGTVALNTTTTAPRYSASQPAPTSAAAAPTTEAPAEAPTARNAWEDGTYVVGQDIRPGRYRTDGASEDAVFRFCMASRQRLDGTPIGMPESTNTGPAYITVRASDGQVQFTGPCTWTSVGG